MYSFNIETSDSRGQGLNPQKAHITDISLATAAGTTVWSGDDEALTVKQWDSAVYDLPPGLISTWNGTFFDLPFLSTRMEDLGFIHSAMVLTPAEGFVPEYDLMPGHDSGYTAAFLSKSGMHAHLDIAYAFKRVAADFGVNWGLEPVARALGFEVVELDPTRLHNHTDEERDAYTGSGSALIRQLTMWLLNLDAAYGLDS